MGGNVSLGAAQQLAKQLGKAPTFQWPIRLTPRTPFHAGIAALVFVSPHVISPADDLAEFGYPVPDPAPYDGNPPPQGPPHDGAHLVAWLNPPEASREYSVEFKCEGVKASTFVLDQLGGGEETKDVAASKTEITAAVNITTTAGGGDWVWLSLSANDYWKLFSCEISPLP